MKRWRSEHASTQNELLQFRGLFRVLAKATRTNLYPAARIEGELRRVQISPQLVIAFMASQFMGWGSCSVLMCKASNLKDTQKMQSAVSLCVTSPS